MEKIWQNKNKEKRELKRDYVVKIWKNNKKKNIEKKQIK